MKSEKKGILSVVLVLAMILSLLIGLISPITEVHAKGKYLITVVGAETIYNGSVEITESGAESRTSVTTNGIYYGKPGQSVMIVAEEDTERKIFSHWEIISGDFELDDPNSAKTTFIMPASDVEIKAVYDYIGEVKKSRYPEATAQSMKIV